MRMSAARFLAQWIVTFIAVLAMSIILPVIGFPELRYTSLTSVAIFAAVLAILNAFVKPVLQILTCPINILTLGLFTLVINALMFLVADRLAGGAFAGHNIGFGVSFVAALVVSIASIFVGLFVKDD